MRCPNCGNENKATNKFCTKCGTPLPREEEIRRDSFYGGMSDMSSAVRSFDSFEDEKTAVLDDFDSFENEKTVVLDDFDTFEDEKTVVLDDFDSFEDEKTVVLDDFDSFEDEKTVVLDDFDSFEDEKTVVLDDFDSFEDEKTVVLDDFDSFENKMAVTVDDIPEPAREETEVRDDAYGFEIFENEDTYRPDKGSAEIKAAAEEKSAASEAAASVAVNADAGANVNANANTNTNANGYDISAVDDEITVILQEPGRTPPPAPTFNYRSVYKEHYNNVQDTAYIDHLRKLKGLLDDGIITEEEFVQKKKQILGI